MGKSDDFKIFLFMPDGRKKIAICDYSFIAFNGKKIREEYFVQMGSLVGSDINEIKSDSRNLSQMRRIFMRNNKGRAGISEFNFHFSKIIIKKFSGYTYCKY